MTAPVAAEAWRYRRTAYASGRKEMIGWDKRDFRFGKPTRKVKKKSVSVLGTASPFKGKSWRRY